jgi:hypothetical protein
MNVRIFKVDWYNGKPIVTGGGYQLAYQGDDMSNMVIFDKAPNLDNYYLVVSMKLDEADNEPTTLPAIQLEGPFWVVPNYYTQNAQTILFQCCSRTPQGNYEHHSAWFSGTILPSIKHNGNPIDLSPMFDPYMAILDDKVTKLIIAAGDVQIDSEMSDSSTNPLQNKVITGRLEQQAANIGDLSQLQTEEKSDLVSAINEAAQTGSSGGTEREWNLPTLKIYGDISQMTAEKNEPKIYQYIWEDPDNKEQRTGYCSMKWQGESSLFYPKKNYTIKFFHDAKYKRKDKISLFDDLKLKKSKWVVKANWVDRSMARNIVTCQLWGQMVRSRNGAPVQNLVDTPNYGAINGHPVKVYVNDVWHGLYTFNIPKDEDLFGMEEGNPLHCAICGDAQSGTSAVAFRVASISGWELEVPEDAWASYEVEEEGQTVTKYVKDGLINLINFVMNATDAEFKESLNDYLDVESAIDYYLMVYLNCGIDSLGRNLILLTYDGGNKWYCSLYDADTTWGNGIKGAPTYDPTLPCPEGYQMKTSLLWERLEACFGDELYSRWTALRKNIFRADYIKAQFDYLWGDITEELYEADEENWKYKDVQNPAMPQWNVDFKTKIFEFIDGRLPYCDAEFKAMRTPVACTGITLSESSISFANGNPVTLVATVEPENTTDEVTWETSDETVAVVGDGNVYPVGVGTATITATCGYQTATCSVAVTGLSFSVTLAGDNATLTNTGTVAPNSAYTGTLTVDTGYRLTSVVVTMGGHDITASAYNGNAISVAQVTGNIIVTVSTEFVYDDTGLAFELDSAFVINGRYFIDTGFQYDCTSPLTIAIDLTQPDDMTSSANNLYMFGATRKDGGKAGWLANYRGIVGVQGKSTVSGFPATPRFRARAVLRYNPTTRVLSTRSSGPDSITGVIAEKTSSNGHTTVTNPRPDRDAFATSMYIGGVHGVNGLESASNTGKIHDMRIYTRRWTDEEVKHWLGVDSLSTVFTDDMDQ